jgi:hypothetical protein
MMNAQAIILTVMLLITVERFNGHYLLIHLLLLRFQNFI